MSTVQGGIYVHPTITPGADFAVAQQVTAVIQGAVNLAIGTVTAGGSAPSVPAGQTGVLQVDASVTNFIGGGIIATGYRSFLVGDTYNPITVTGGAALGQGVLLGAGLGPSGIVTYNAAGGSGTVVGGDGNKAVNLGTGTNFAVYTGAGNDVVNLSASAASGQNTVSAGAGQNQVRLGAAATQVQSTGSDTISVSTGSTTVQAIGNAAVNLIAAAGNIDASTGARTLINGGGYATVAGAAGSATVFAATGGGMYQGGTAGNNLLLGGSGQTYLTGANTGDVLIATSTSNQQVLQAGAGNETLLGSLSTMNNLYAVGSGADLIIAGAGSDTIVGGSGAATVTGGAGADVFQFNAVGNHGGSMTITDFTPGTDHVRLLNYADAPANLAAQAQIVGPATARITLSDGSSITFVGLSSVTQGFFS